MLATNFVKRRSRRAGTTICHVVQALAYAFLGVSACGNVYFLLYVEVKGTELSLS